MGTSEGWATRHRVLRQGDRTEPLGHVTAEGSSARTLKCHMGHRDSSSGGLNRVAGLKAVQDLEVWCVVVEAGPALPLPRELKRGVPT